jgi:hypothetical protein
MVKGSFPSITQITAAIPSWDDSAAVKVTLNDSSASFTGTGISETGSVITISQSGTYVFSGSYAGRIVVNTTSKETVRIILNGAEITSSYNSAIEVTKAEKVIITAAKGTKNAVTDPDTYTLNSDSEPTAWYNWLGVSYYLKQLVKDEKEPEKLRNQYE